MYAIELITQNFEKWIGYCEKNSLKDLGIDLDLSENYTKKAGNLNFTIFSKVYEKMTGVNVQGQAWCDTFIDTIFIHVFGLDTARRMLGGFSAYTPSSSLFFKKMDRYHTIPQKGDVGFFKNSQRIYHTFFVIDFDGETLVTIEGNTTTKEMIDENGGCVAKKYYNFKTIKDKIDGFGRPDYQNSLEEGWKLSADGERWWYLMKNGDYIKNSFAEKNGLTYYFDDKGYMKTGLCKIKDEVCLFCDQKGKYEGSQMFVNNSKEMRIII